MFIVGIAAMLVIGFGGIALGIVMLRNGFRPRITPILLMIFLPVHVRDHDGDLARQRAPAADVGLGHRRTRRDPIRHTRRPQQHIRHRHSRMTDDMT